MAWLLRNQQTIKRLCGSVEKIRWDGGLVYRRQSGIEGMSAFIDLQNKIRNSPYLPSAEKMEMLSLLGEVSEENVKTINELTDSTCRSVTFAVVSMLAEKSEKGEKKNENTND